MTEYIYTNYYFIALIVAELLALGAYILAVRGER